MKAAWLLALVRSAAVRLGEIFRRRRLARELDEEVRLHIELETEFNVKRGMPPDEARRAARAGFGCVRRYTEDAMDARGFVALDNTARDIRFAFRRLWRTPTFTAGVVAAMTIGMASAIGIGTLVFQVLLRPLPYDHPETLARVLVHTPGLGTGSTESSGGLLVYFRERSRSFAALGFYYESEGVTVTDGDHPEHLSAALISPNVLDMVGAHPAAGRLFRDEDTRARPVPVMISHEVWVRRFGSDPDVSGKTIELNRDRRAIVGVLPRGFDFPSPSVGIWYPEGVSATRAGLNFRHLNVLGRLRPGVSAHAAGLELGELASHISERFPEISVEDVRASGLTVSVETLKEAVVAPVRAELTLLGIMVVVVLLVATANVTTLFLLRAERMRGEIALSRALGAGPAALLRRFLADGLVVAVASGIAAVPLISIMLGSKLGLSSAQLPRANEVALSRGVFVALAIVVSVLGIILGVIAAARASDGGIGLQLRASGHGARARGWRRAQRGLVAAQVASAMALLFAAGLVGQSLRRLSQVDIGFMARPSITFDVSLPYRQYPRFEDGAAFHASVIRGIAGLPGVQAVTAAMGLPFDAGAPGFRRRLVTDDERTVREATARPNVVPPDYFQTMGIPIRAGRSFAAGDLAAAAPGVVISASLAREMFGRVDAVGRQLRIQDSMNYPPYRVIGVVGDVFGERIQDGIVSTLYFPLLAEASPAPVDPGRPYIPRIPYNPSGMRFVVWTDMPVSAVLPGIRRVLATADSKVPVTKVSSLGEIAARASAHARLMMVLLAIAATAALLLSAIGVYCVIAYAVAGRGREFGVRLALGATPQNVISGVLSDSVALVAAGIGVGVVISLAGSTLIRGVLFEVSATSPLTYTAATIVVVLVSVAAAYIPAHTAGHTDPTIALRSE